MSVLRERDIRVPLLYRLSDEAPLPKDELAELALSLPTCWRAPMPSRRIFTDADARTGWSDRDRDD